MQDAFTKSESQRDLLIESSIRDRDKEAERRRRRRLIFIFCIAVVTTVFIVLAAVIPFLLGNKAYFFQLLRSKLIPGLSSLAWGSERRENREIEFVSISTCLRWQKKS